MLHKTSSRLIAYTLVFLTISACQFDRNQQVFTPDSIADSAMVVTAHRAATEVGIQILKQGGNAYDAAIAVQFALAVVYPQAGNIGGGGFAVVRLADGTTETLDFREKAPLAASQNMYLDSLGNVIEGKSTKGHKAVGVPGVVDGMVKLHQKYGTLPWSELVKPAIGLAQKGFALKEEQANRINRYQDEFNEQNSYRIPLINEKGWQKGDSIKLPQLANTLQLIADSARGGFYDGSTARKIIAEMQRGKGLITLEDLELYESKWREPLIGNYKEHKIITMAPPSSGGVALLQLLQGSRFYDLGNYSPDDAKRVHLMTELMRRVYADRATYLGDPDYIDVPIQMLLDSVYNVERFSTIDSNRKTPSAEIKEGNVEVIESTETTHFTIVDKDRNAVAITTTVNGLFGCKVMVEGAGFFLNNEMDDFSAKPGVANQFGLVGSQANAIAPQKRMLSSMTPTIIEKEGELYMTIGTRGGATIITAVYETIINVIDNEMSLKEAVEVPKFHHQWQPDEVYLEGTHYNEQTKNGLEELGHKVDFKEVLGKMRGVLVHPDGSLEGACDPRRSQGVAIGY